MPSSQTTKIKITRLWAPALALGLAWVASLGALVAAPRLAKAQVGYGFYGYETFGYGYMPMPVVVSPGPPLLVYENQYFDVTVRGVTRLCENHPELCQAPSLQSSLKRLQHLKTIGTSLAWTGLATAVVGPVVSTSVNCAKRDTYCRPNDWVVLGTVVGGLAMGITGLAITPESHNVVNFINKMNKEAPDHPVQLKLSVQEQRLPNNEVVRQASVVASRDF